MRIFTHPNSNQILTIIIIVICVPKIKLNYNTDTNGGD